MPKIATPKFADLKAEESGNILNKLVLRTALMSETYFAPTTPVEGRSEWATKYVANVYDNPDHRLYQNGDAAFIAAELAGQKLRDEDLTMTRSREVKPVFGTVIVPVNSLWYTHPENIQVGQPHICVGSRSAFYRSATKPNDKVVLRVTTISARPATEDEIAIVLNALMDARPAQTIKTLGDSLDGIAGDGSSKEE